jgi:UDP-glucose 4-epimerase
MADAPSHHRRIVVTGAAGFIGSHLVDRLLADGCEVVGIDSFEDYYPQPLKDANLVSARTSDRFTLVPDNLLALAAAEGAAPGADAYPGEARLAALLAGAGCVVHLAAQAGVRASWGRSFRAYSDNNVLATQLVLEACKQVGVPKLVYASSSSVYGDTDQLPMREDANCRPVSPYGVTKLAGEQLCRLYHRYHGVPAVSLRFFTVYGPRQRPDMAFNIFLRALFEGRPLEMYGEGNQTRDFTFVSDIVDGILLAMKGRDGAVYNLGGGSRVTLLEAIRSLEAASGCAARLKGESVQAGDVKHTWADLSLAAEELGYAPHVSLAEGLRREADWLRTLRV